MSIAYNFPDISISPIREEDENDLINISCSSDGSRARAAHPNQTLPVEIQSSTSIHLDSSESEIIRQSQSQHAGDPLNIDVISPGAPIANKNFLSTRTPVHIDDRESSVDFDFSDHSPSQHSVVPAGDIRDSLHPDVVVPDSKSIDLSSEDAFQQLERSMGRSLFASNSSADVGADTSDPITHIMRGVRVFVDLKCCAESESAVRAKLRSMGATVFRTLSPETTHVVFNRGGTKKTLEHVLSRESNRRPFLLDPHWVHDSYFNRARMDELAYSLYGCRYLVDSLRRQSHHHRSSNAHNQSSANQENEVVELTPEDIDVVQTTDHVSHRADGSSSIINLSDESLELNFGVPMTATQLLGRIDVLSKRLDRCAEDNVPHATRCPSRMRNQNYNFINAATNTCKEIEMTPKSSLLRRRTHGAFGLEYRAPGSLAVYSRLADRDAYEAENGIRDITNKLANMGTISGGPARCAVVNDMRKATESNLNNIRGTLRQNAQLEQRKAGKRGRGGSQVTIPRNQKLRGPAQGNGRLESIQESTDQPDRTPTDRIRRPIVKTASDLINRLQCIPSSDEFEGRKESRLPIKKKVPQSARSRQKLEVVLTGFTDTEKMQITDELDDSRLNLSVQTSLSDDTRCVVSATGNRTMQVLKAVVNKIPIVSLDWVYACLEEDRLVPTSAHEYDDWKRVIKARSGGCTLFQRIGTIFVHNACIPPASDLCMLIRMSSGKMTMNEKSCALIVAPEALNIVPPRSRRSCPAPIVVNEKYILDCISRNEVLLVSGYSR